MERNRWRLAVALVAVLAAIGAFILADRLSTERAVAAQRDDARNEAAILVASLGSELDKFRLVPLTLSEDPDVEALVARAGGGAGRLNRRLESLADQSGAAAIYVMDSAGDTLAASNWRLDTSFVGSNYAFRRYFREALAKGSASQFALGTVSREPGLYIAQRIGPADNPNGVVAVKIEFDGTEQTWREATAGVYVTDAAGVVLLTSNPDWRFRLTGDAAKSARDPQRDLRQFGKAKLRKLEVGSNEPGGARVQLPLLDTRVSVAPVNWDLHLLVDPGPAVRSAKAAGRLAVALLIALLAAATLALVTMRRRRAAAEAAHVNERTRQLREQLSQANRLATLGQVTAGVGHEIAQPVAAIRLFAESGEKLADRKEHGEAGGNFREIVKLSDRIGRITSELRRFSRRQPADRRPMPVGDVIDGALLLLRDRLRTLDVVLVMPPQDLNPTLVSAEHVRLEQVLVNLLQNAMDAAGEGGRVEIALELDASARHLILRVLDSGPGLDEGAQEQLFQPFATSKSDGLGLGLVISRDIMRDLGGDLRFEADRDRTTFAMIIPLAPS